MTDYQQHLKSKDWRRRRAEARRRAGGRCRVCGTRANLHTHHKTYARLGREPQHDLVVLCATHHAECHAFIDNWYAKGWKRKSPYALTMKYVARARKQMRQA